MTVILTRGQLGKRIVAHLDAADVILLLVSPDFMASDYCYGVELKRALERHKRGQVRVIPIILRPVYWQGILGMLQALPKDGKPVAGSEPLAKMKHFSMWPKAFGKLLKK